MVDVQNKMLFSLKKEGNSGILTVWINLGTIMLNDISQAKEEKFCMISLIYVESKKIELTEVESKMMVTRDWVMEEEGNGELVKEFKVSDRREEYVLRSIAQQHNYSQ